jgi:hypothetical protein
MTDGSTMRMGQLLSATYGKPIRDSWIYAHCPDCDAVSNLGSTPSETREDAVVYLCSECRAVVIELRHVGGDEYQIHDKAAAAGKEGFGILVPDDYKPG